MSDMYGAVRSNSFKVKDPAAFKEWFNTAVKFGDDIELWDSGESFSFGGYEQYPQAYPQIPATEPPDDCEDEEQWFKDHPECNEYSEDWDLEEFAAEVRKHLQPGEEFRVCAAGHEKLRYVAYTHLKITETKVEFINDGEG